MIKLKLIIFLMKIKTFCEVFFYLILIFTNSNNAILIYNTIYSIIVFHAYNNFHFVQVNMKKYVKIIYQNIYKIIIFVIFLFSFVNKNNKEYCMLYYSIDFMSLLYFKY